MKALITSLVLAVAAGAAAAAAVGAAEADAALFNRVLSTSTEASAAVPDTASARSAVEPQPAPAAAEIRPAARSRALQWVGVGTPPTLWRVPTPPVTPAWRFVPGVSSGSGYWPQIMGAMVAPAAGSAPQNPQPAAHAHGRSKNVSATAIAAPATAAQQKRTPAVQQKGTATAVAPVTQQKGTAAAAAPAAQLSALQPLAAAATGQTVIARLNSLTSEQYRSSGAAATRQQAYRAGALPALDALGHAAHRSTAARHLSQPAAAAAASQVSVAVAAPSVASERRGEAAAAPGWLRVYPVPGAPGAAMPEHKRETYARELRLGDAAQNVGDLSGAESRRFGHHHAQQYRAEYVPEPGEVVLAGRQFQYQQQREDLQTAAAQPMPQQQSFRAAYRPAARRPPARRSFGGINSMISRLFGSPQSARQHRPRPPFFQVPPHQSFQQAPPEPAPYPHDVQQEFRQQQGPRFTHQRNNGFQLHEQNLGTTAISGFEPITESTPSSSSLASVAQTETPATSFRPVQFAPQPPAQLGTQLESEQVGSGLFQASPQAQVQLEGVEVARQASDAVAADDEDNQWQTEAAAHAQSQRSRHWHTQQAPAPAGVGTVEVVAAPGALAAASRPTPSADFSTGFLPTRNIPTGITTETRLGYFAPIPEHPSIDFEPVRLTQPQQSLDAVSEPVTAAVPNSTPEQLNIPPESGGDQPRMKSRQKTEQRDDGTVVVTGALLEDPDTEDVVELVIEYDNDLESIVDDLLREVGGGSDEDDQRSYKLPEPAASQLRRRRLSVQQLDERLGLAHQPYYHVAMALYGLTGGRPPADAR